MILKCVDREEYTVNPSEREIIWWEISQDVVVEGRP
jgi:hypothetical protein